MQPVGTLRERGVPVNHLMLRSNGPFAAPRRGQHFRKFRNVLALCQAGVTRYNRRLMVPVEQTSDRSRFKLAVVAVAIAVTLGLGLPATFAVSTLTQPETDNLAAGGQLATALAGEGSLKERLAAGFGGVERNPRVARLKGGSAWMRKVVEPPLPRWAAGIAMSGETAEEGAEPDAWSGLDRARYASSFLLGISLALLFLFIARRPKVRRAELGNSRDIGSNEGEGPSAGARAWAAGAMVIVALGCPGILDAGSGAAYGSTLMLASTLLMLATVHAARGGSGVWAGLAWGLCLGCHPSAMFFIVPVFATIAASHWMRTRQDAGTNTIAVVPEGHLVLPSVALSGFAVPLVGVVTVVLLWPALWQDTGKSMAVWLTDTYRLMEPEQRVSEFAFSQGKNKVPSGWVTLVQTASWLPFTVVGLWFIGLVATARSKAHGIDTGWFAIMYLVTLLVIGTTAGGLFFGRQSLLPMLWAPVLATAGFGLAALLDWAHRRWVRDWIWPAGAVAVASLTVVVGLVIPPSAPPGAGVLQPLPIALLERIAAERDAVRVAVIGGSEGWGRPLEIAAEYAGIDLKPSPIHTAHWVVVVQEPSVRASTSPNWLKGLPTGEPAMKEVAGGLTFEAFKR